MSDYEVNLVNDSMQEFFVRFYGPEESTSTLRCSIYRPFGFVGNHNGCTD
jgi:hypothetical protein